MLQVCLHPNISASQCHDCVHIKQSNCNIPQFTLWRAFFSMFWVEKCGNFSSYFEGKRCSGFPLFSWGLLDGTQLFFRVESSLLKMKWLRILLNNSHTKIDATDLSCWWLLCWFIRAWGWNWGQRQYHLFVWTLKKQGEGSQIERGNAWIQPWGVKSKEQVSKKGRGKRVKKSKLQKDLYYYCFNSKLFW